MISNESYHFHHRWYIESHRHHSLPLDYLSAVHTFSHSLISHLTPGQSGIWWAVVTNWEYWLSAYVSSFKWYVTLLQVFSRTLVHVTTTMFLGLNLSTPSVSLLFKRFKIWSLLIDNCLLLGFTKKWTSTFSNDNFPVARMLKEPLPSLLPNDTAPSS